MLKYVLLSALYYLFYHSRFFFFFFYNYNNFTSNILFQLDAHVGSVNDIAFSNPLNQMSIISCGDDKTIKVGNGVAVNTT